jgi:hypothetical protein
VRRGAPQGVLPRGCDVQRWRLLPDRLAADAEGRGVGVVVLVGVVVVGRQAGCGQARVRVVVGLVVVGLLLVGLVFVGLVVRLVLVRLVVVRLVRVLTGSPPRR